MTSGLREELALERFAARELDLDSASAYAARNYALAASLARDARDARTRIAQLEAELTTTSTTAIERIAT